MEAINRSPILTLPIECTQMILMYLPDVLTLQAAILSHRSFNDAFSDCKSLTIRKVLSNIMPPDLLPDALFLLHASNVKPWTQEKVYSILSYHANRYSPSACFWSLKDAYSIQVLHHAVSYFTDDFLLTTLLNNALVQAPEDPISPPSLSEWCRVARAFYLHDVVCYLFKERDQEDSQTEECPDFTLEEQWELFFSGFAIWELEQLGCVSEYLYRQLSIPYNEVAAHDVTWGYFAVQYGDSEIWDFDWNFSKCHAVSKGLGFVYQVITAQTFEECRALLGYPFPEGSTGWTVVTELSRLNFCHIWGDYEETKDTLFENYTPDGIIKILKKGAGPDRDPGPAESWRWTHLGLARSGFICGDKHRELRRQGYVMWDYARLDRWGVLSSPSVIPPDRDDPEPSHRIAEMHASFQRRRALFKKGARGWWKEGHESQLRWVTPEGQWDDESDDSDDYFLISPH